MFSVAAMKLSDPGRSGSQVEHSGALGWISTLTTVVAVTCAAIAWVWWPLIIAWLTGAVALSLWLGPRLKTAAEQQTSAPQDETPTMQDQEGAHLT